MEQDHYSVFTPLLKSSVTLFIYINTADIIFSPKSIYNLWFWNNRDKGKGMCKPEFEMKYGKSGYNICPIVTVFIYIKFEQSNP